MPENASAITERFRAAGARDLANADRGVGFVKWEEEGTYITGIITDVWECDDRDIATVRVIDLTAPVFTKGEDKEPVEVSVETGDLVCVSLGTARLKNTVNKNDVNKMLVIHYKGTEQTKKGNTVKLFELYAMDSDSEQLPF